MRIFDTHAHYDDAAFDEDRDELLKNMFAGNIDTIVNVGASLDGCRASVEMADKYEQMYAAVGVHPECVESLTEEDVEWMKKQALGNPKVVAIGEIGLDYHYPEPPVDVQKTWFKRQLDLAYEVNKPVSIHSREACKDTLDILRESKIKETGGIVHCYSYSKESVRDFLKLGLHFGIGGVVTFKNAKKLIEALESIPLDKLLLETDCPYLSPVPHRGERNYSGNITFVVEKLAEVYGKTSQEIIDITNLNAKELFRI